MKRWRYTLAIVAGATLAQRVAHHYTGPWPWFYAVGFTVIVAVCLHGLVRRLGPLLRPQDHLGRPLADILTVKGGARLGWLNASYPFATLSADSEALQISCLGRNYRFPKSSIRRLSKHTGFFSIGLSIEHDQESEPQMVVFWVSVSFGSGFKHLKGNLEKLGYEINDG